MPTLEDYHAPYPAAAPGQERKVIYLPAQDSGAEQRHLRLQLIPGRHEDCEDGRLYELTGTVEHNVIEGWGYPYYVVTLGEMYAVHRSPSDPENATTFVALHETPMLAYNSKLPIVVYVPEGAEVRYRVWSDKEALMDAVQQQQQQQQQPEQHSEPPAHQSRGIALPEPAYPGEATEAAEPAAAQEHSAPPSLTDDQYVTQTNEAPVMTAHEQEQEPPVREKENHRHSSRAAPAGYAADPHSPPALRSVEEEAQEREAQQRGEAQEAYPQDTAANDTAPTSEKRHRSSSKPRKHSTSDNTPRRSSLTSFEKEAPVETPTSAKKSRSGSASKKGASEDGYEKKAKNFWNRARSDSTPRKSSATKRNSSPKKSGGDKWSEM